MPSESHSFETDALAQVIRDASNLVRNICEFEDGYDIFLSFKGLDTGKKFTDHLYKALKQEGYRTFMLDNEIERGDNINSELKKKIGNSRISVVVLSENYANSTACLFELQTILEHRQTSDHIILPVFYDVDPSKIKEQADKLNFEKMKVTVEKVNGWGAALKEVANMAGMVSQNQSNGYEAELIENILECIHKKIGDTIDLSTQWQRLDRSLQSLLAQAEDIRAKVQSEMLQIWKRPTKEVGVWFRDVASLKGDVQRLEQVVFGESRVSRVRLRKIIAEKVQQVAELHEKGRGFKDLLVDAFPIDRLFMPPTSVESTDARNVERIREYLRDTLLPCQI